MSRQLLRGIFSRRNFIHSDFVTFNVSEWFLDPNHITPFTDTLVGPLHYMSIKIGDEIKLTDALGNVTFELEAGEHTYEVYDMVRYLTTKKGTVTVVDAAVSVDVKIYACLYTPTQVNSMISTESYIPVASAAELDGLRNATGRRMGQGTIHDTVSDVVTGVDKKYVQAGNIANVNSEVRTVVDGFTFRGNELYIGMNGNRLFRLEQSGASCYLYDIVINAESYISNYGLLFGIEPGAGNLTRIENCHGYGNSNAFINNNYGTIIDSSFLRQTSRANGFLMGDNYGDIVRCGFSGKHSDYGSFGFYNYGTIESCSVVDSEISTSLRFAGAIVGINQGVIRETYGYNNSIISSASNSIISFVGGLIGATTSASALIENCYSEGGSVKGNGATNTQIGGLAGRTSSSAMIVNSYSTTFVDATAGQRGGLTGDLISGIITNSYYNSQTSGMSDTGKGLPRTSLQLKNGTIDSYINPDGTTDLTNDPANAMFTGWDALIWDFSDNTQYPNLI